MIRREDAKMVDKLDGHSVVTSNSFGYYMFIQETQCSCKRDWLEEIKVCKVCGSTLSGKEFFDSEMCADCWNHKDEPMSATDWINKKHNNPEKSRKIFTFFDMGEAFEAGAAESEKKHRLQQTFTEYCDSRRHGFSFSPAEAWHAHAKATNTEA